MPHSIVLKGLPCHLPHAIVHSLCAGQEESRASQGSCEGLDLQMERPGAGTERSVLQPAFRHALASTLAEVGNCQIMIVCKATFTALEPILVQHWLMTDVTYCVPQVQSGSLGTSIDRRAKGHGFQKHLVTSCCPIWQLQNCPCHPQTAAEVP